MSPGLPNPIAQKVGLNLYKSYIGRGSWMKIECRFSLHLMDVFPHAKDFIQ